MKINNPLDPNLIRLRQQIDNVRQKVHSNLTREEQDSVSISEAAKIASKLRNSPEIRAERIRVIQQLIAEERLVVPARTLTS